MRIVRKFDTANGFIVSHTFTISKRTNKRVTRRFLIVANSAMGHFMSPFKQDGEGKPKLQRRGSPVISPQRSAPHLEDESSCGCNASTLSCDRDGKRACWGMSCNGQVKSVVPDPGAPMELSLVG
jgi:hypothetical protein